MKRMDRKHRKSQFLLTDRKSSDSDIIYCHYGSGENLDENDRSICRKSEKLYSKRFIKRQ